MQTTLKKDSYNVFLGTGISDECFVNFKVVICHSGKWRTPLQTFPFLIPNFNTLVFEFVTVRCFEKQFEFNFCCLFIFGLLILKSAFNSVLVFTQKPTTLSELLREGSTGDHS